jgi:hypothetical protein
MTALSRIAEKLARLRAEGWRQHTDQLGVEAHRFIMNDPMSESAIGDFEERHGITLPSGYREFLLTIGNGGAGPYYGILPLSQWCRHVGVDPTPTDHLARENPLPVGFRRTEEWPTDLGIDEEDAFLGTLCICPLGCESYGLLVVSGPHRGRVLYVDLEYPNPPPSFLPPPFFVPDTSFLAWYERWLDETLAGLEVLGFGWGPGGSEPDLIALLGSNAPDPDRATAARELGRRRTPSTEVVEALTAATKDPVPAVQAAALLALRHSPEAAGRLAPSLLKSGSEEVRRAAAWALGRTGNKSGVGPLREALPTERDEATLGAIGGALAELDGLVATDLFDALIHPDPAIRRQAAYLVGESASPDAIPHLISSLGDEDEQVRQEAVLALGQLSDPSIELALDAHLRGETSGEVRLSIESILDRRSRRRRPMAQRWRRRALLWAATITIVLLVLTALA